MQPQSRGCTVQPGPSLCANRCGTLPLIGDLLLPDITRRCLVGRRVHMATDDCYCRTPDLPLAFAGSDMIRWGKVLLSHTLDAARSY